MQGAMDDGRTCTGTAVRPDVVRVKIQGVGQFR